MKDGFYRADCALDIALGHCKEHRQGDDLTPDAFRDLITPLSAAEAFDRVWPDVEQFWEDGPDEEAEEGLIGSEDVRHPIQLIALADARVSALVPGDHEIPVISPERTDEVVEAFLASEHGIADVEAARAFARVVASAAVEQNRDPVVYGPASLTAVLILNVAARLHVSDEDLALLPDLVRAWACFTSSRSSLMCSSTSSSFRVAWAADTTVAPNRTMPAPKRSFGLFF